MNIFNAFQVLAFYTLMPIAIIYLAEHDHVTFAFLFGGLELSMFVVLADILSDNGKR